jgi:hypothetical protein
MKKIESWADITIGQYQEMMLIETENDITRFIQQISIALDIDSEEIRKLSLLEFKKLQENMSFLSVKVEADLSPIIEIDGKKYGLIPDMGTVDAGTFIDAEQFKEDTILNLHNLVALIYRPVIKQDGDEYEIERHKAEGFERRANLFKEKVSIETVMGAVVFFSSVATELSINLLTYLADQHKTQETPTKTKKTRTRTKKVKE